MNWFKGFFLFLFSLMLIASDGVAQEKKNPPTEYQKSARRPLPKQKSGGRGFERFAGRDASARLAGIAGTRDPDFRAGVNYSEAGDHLQAVEAFKRALNKPDLVPDIRIKALNYLGFSYSALGQNKLAIEALQKAVDLDPSNYVAFFNLGNTYADDAQYEKAIEAYKRVLGLQANVPRVYYNMGIAYIELDRPEDAIKAFREAIKLRDDHAMAYYNLGVLYGTAGDYKEAAEAFKQALILKQKDVAAQYTLEEAHFNLGLALAKLNQKAEAMEQYRELKKLKSKLGDELLAFLPK